MPKPLSRDATVLFAIFLVSLTFFVLNAVFGSSRQTITVHATNDGLPLSGLELRLMVSGRDCGADSRSVYRSGTTDAGGVASWSRPITRKKGRRWIADN